MAYRLAKYKTIDELLPLADDLIAIAYGTDLILMNWQKDIVIDELPQVARKMDSREPNAKFIICKLLQLTPKQLFVSYHSGLIQLIDLNDRKLIKAFQGHKSKILHLELYQNDQLISCSATEFKIWNINSGHCLQSYSYDAFNTGKSDLCNFSNFILVTPEKMAMTAYYENKERHLLIIFDLKHGNVDKIIVGILCHHKVLKLFTDNSNNIVCLTNNNPVIPHLMCYQFTVMSYYNIDTGNLLSYHKFTYEQNLNDPLLLTSDGGLLTTTNPLYTKETDVFDLYK